MRRQKEGATAATMAPKETLQSQCYRSRLQKSSTINQILASLLFALQNQRLTSSERTAILDSVEGLIRLKIELGLLKGVCCAC